MEAAERQARDIVMRRAGDRCELAIDDVCLGGADSVHHRKKRRYDDGGWRASNLLAACGNGVVGCHGYVEGHPEWAQSKGLWLLGHESPTDTSCFIRWENAKSWWFLDDEGLLHWEQSDFEPLRLRRRT